MLSNDFHAEVSLDPGKLVKVGFVPFLIEVNAVWKDLLAMKTPTDPFFRVLGSFLW